MRKSMLAVAIALSGCATTPTPRLAEIERPCVDLTTSAYGLCLSNRLTEVYPNWRDDDHGDLVQTYLAWVTAAGNRVAAGVMSEDEAKLGSALMLTRLKEIAAQRDANAAQAAQARAASQQASINQMLMGLALIESSRYTIPTPAPSAPITCRTSAPNRITGQVLTTCQ